MKVVFTARVFKEGRTFVAHAVELDVASCGGSREKARRNLREAVRLFLEEADKMGSLERILEDAGCGDIGSQDRRSRVRQHVVCRSPGR